MNSNIMQSADPFEPFVGSYLTLNQIPCKLCNLYKFFSPQQNQQKLKVREIFFYKLVHTPISHRESDTPFI